MTSLITLVYLHALDHRIPEWVGLEGAFRDQLVQFPYCGQGHLSLDEMLEMMLKAPHNLALNTSRDGASTASLGNPRQSHHSHSKECCHYIQSKSTLLRFKNAAPCTVTEGPGKVFLCLSYKPLGSTGRPQQHLPRTCSVQAKQPQLSALLHSRGVPALRPFSCPSSGPT